MPWWTYASVDARELLVYKARFVLYYTGSKSACHSRQMLSCVQKQVDMTVIRECFWYGVSSFLFRSRTEIKDLIIDSVAGRRVACVGDWGVPNCDLAYLTDSWLEMDTTDRQGR